MTGGTGAVPSFLIGKIGFQRLRQPRRPQRGRLQRSSYWNNVVGNGKGAISARRVAAAFFAAIRRLRVIAAFLPAARCLRVAAAFFPAARRLRVSAAFFATAWPCLVFAGFWAALRVVALFLFIGRGTKARSTLSLTLFSSRAKARAKRFP